MNGSTRGEAVDAKLEIATLDEVYGDCRRTGPHDQVSRRRDGLRSVALLVIADAYCTEQPQGWRVAALRAVELADAITRAYGIRHAIDDLGDAYLCVGDRPLVWLGHAGTPLGGVVWTAGAWPSSLDEFPAAGTLGHEMERAAFLDGLYRRGLSGSEPYLDAEHVALLRAAEWSALAERDVERRVMVNEGLALLCIKDLPIALIGRVHERRGRMSLADMTSKQRARWIGDLTGCLPESLGPLELLETDFGQASAGLPAVELLAEVVR